MWSMCEWNGINERTDPSNIESLVDYQYDCHGMVRIDPIDKTNWRIYYQAPTDQSVQG